jgi:predicted RecB family nuclease
VVNDNSQTYYAHWAKDKTEEATAWSSLLDTINLFPDAPIFHYGNYEVRAVDHLQKRHAVDSSSIKNRLINVTSFVFGRVYFPVKSNSQKELGKYCGMTWTAPEASGLQSLVWRYRWERSRDERHKEYLLTYNQEDCAALSVLVDFLTNIGDVGSDYPKVQSADKPAKDATELGVRADSGHVC